MKKTAKILLFALALAASALPPLIFAAAKPKLYYGGWMPYWKTASSTQITALHLEKLNELSPFSYEVKSDGTLIDQLGLGQKDFWPAWLQAVRDSGIKITPTIAWSDADAVYNVLSKKTKRQKHENQIVAVTKIKNINGIDIDYESIGSKNFDNFALFIKELSGKLHGRGKILTCTVQARTPPDSLYKVIPATLKYAYSLTSLNRYCDEVRIMTYDQRDIDILLNQAKGGNRFYIPVADPAWVEKVIKESLKFVKPRKIMLGIPTYGYEYNVTYDQNGVNYKIVRSLNYDRAMDLANQLGITPGRNSAGELSFIYNPENTSVAATQNLNNSLSSVELQFFGKSGPDSSSTPAVLSPSPLRLVWFSDSQAAADKIRLARKYKLKGVIFFKTDNGEDPKIWDEIK